MDDIVRSTDIEHVVAVPSQVLRAYFTVENIKPGDEVTVVLETEMVPDNTNVSVAIVPEDDPDAEPLNTAEGQVSSNRCEVTLTPMEETEDEATLDEKLGQDHFRTFIARIEIESHEINFDNPSNRLNIGLPGVVIESIDEMFAPHHEELNINYRFIDLLDEIKGAKLKVYASNYNGSSYPDDGAIVYTRDLTADERRHDALDVIRWAGDSNAEGGPLQESNDNTFFINPLYSPYTVEIIFSKDNEDPDQDSNAKKNYKRILEDESEVDWQFKVEYHSIEMELGSYLNPDDIPDARTIKWLQWRLNTLGYPSGPVDGVPGAQSEVALRNFQRAHWRVPWPEDEDADRTPLVVDGLPGDSSYSVLESDQVIKRELFSSEAQLFDPSAEVKLYTWANIFYSYQSPIENGEQEWNNTFRNEFFDSRFNPRQFPRHEKEALVLNRPRIPILIRILVKDKTGEPVFSPRAVGDVRVNFRVDDPDEDMEVTAGFEDNVSRTYVNRARQEVNPATGDNCPEDHAGRRSDDADENFKSYIHVGTKYPPFEAQEDSDKKVVYIETPTEGWAMGMAGFFFRPSYQAGDNFKLKAELDFEGHDNEENIEFQESFRAESAKITNWRKMKLAAHLAFGSRQEREGEDNRVSDIVRRGLDYFQKAFIEFDDPEFTGSVEQFLSEDEYKQVVEDTNEFSDEQKNNIQYRPDDFIYPLDVREQNDGEEPRDYTRTIRGEVRDFCDNSLETLGKTIINNIRKKCREGAVMIDFQAGPLLEVYRNKGEDDEELITDDYMPGSYCIGLPNGLVYLDIYYDERRDCPLDFLIAHELGHTCFLMHWENASTGTLSDEDNYEAVENFRSNVDDHDHNCMICAMSYPIDLGVFPAPPDDLELEGTEIGSRGDYIDFIRNKGQDHIRFHQLAENYSPEFCGKCLLKLRGWAVKELPQQY